MRILMMSDVFFPRVNGVSTSILTYRADLLSLGHECTLVSPQYPEPPETTDDSSTVRIPSWRVPFDPEDRVLKWLKLTSWAKNCERGQFDIVHIQTPFTAHYAGLRIARRLGIPAVETYHTYFEHYLHHYIPLLPSILTRTIARRLTLSQCRDVDAVISPSPQMEQALQAYGVSKPIVVLPTGLPPSAFVSGDRDRFRKQHSIAPNRPVALYVGRLAHEKNIDFLIDMLTSLLKVVPDVLLVVAGEGPAESHVRNLVKSRGLQACVFFVGYMDRANTLRDCYSAADVFVFASRTETQGLVILEALAQGTPVVSTAVMGTADVLKGVKGAFVVPELAEPFAAAVARILTEPQLRTDMSNAARPDAQAWASQAMAVRLIRFYERVIQARASSPGRLQS